MKDLALSWPILSFLLVFLVQLLGFELITPLIKPIVGSSSQHIAFLFRIFITLCIWSYLSADWLEAFRLDVTSIPFSLVVILVVYATLFFPWPIPPTQVASSKVSLHILISVWEEILMRGLFLTLLLKVYSDKTFSVILFVGGLFGILHFLNLLHGSTLKEVLPQVIWSCALGIAFSVITFKSGSIVPAILLHCGFNLIPAFWEGTPWLLKKTESHGFYGPAVIGLIFLPMMLLSLWKLADR
ncbi:MAG TPA: CPBP family intramembrane glutamic endopeptidase [Bdellovibrio sp.]|uniref:CPBP family intramembrane glutamic endopeptidase n=1 Tax=Bdellovibrio sp. TaxID=28201 RepID=UPI002F15AECE